MDAEDVAQITESLRQALTAEPANALQAVDEFGWYELLDDQSNVAVATLFALWGELLTPGSAVDQVLLHHYPGSLPTGTRVLLPPLREHRPASRISIEGNVRIDGIVQDGDGPLLVPCLDASSRLAFAVCDAPPPLPGNPLDATAGWRRVTTSMIAVSFDTGSPLGHTDAATVWQPMVAAGRRALSYELLGVGAAMVAMTVEHVCSRKQFGHPIGSFQAVKHQLADVHLWHQIAALSADAAWEDTGEHSAALAKAAATRFTRTARAVCQQLLGGMGFTWEHDFHRYLRRALTLEPLLGDASDLLDELGAALRAGSVSDALVAL